ncbi:ABC transporter permease subunit [Frankia sp. AiPs1]|uniref:ABC transporter permease subunit n=1 Tax=Frankia sp. AiPs1 TaxID=573493 RepID=UPI00204442B8|nr:ABC transporter permease subunit [Frankia sp. AiPs1]MCM3923129.1 ABC transporter permease subunit [Frankia sp. AiPs1]
MIATFRAEWVPMLRPRFLLGTLGAVVGCAVLGTVLTFFSVGHRDFDGDPVTAAALSRSDGLIQGVQAVSILLGVVALSIVAAALAGDHSHGTLRNQLVARPHRAQLLAGKLLALAAFVVLIVAAATAVSVGLSFLLAPTRGVSTAAWSSGAGLADLGTGFVNLCLGSLGYAAIGALAAILLRGPAAAIAVALAYALPVEMLIARIYHPARSWLPVQLMQEIATGGAAAPMPYADALLRGVVYAGVMVLLALLVFRRRDMTA